MSISSNTHVLVFPYPAQGHMIPLLDLSYILSRRGLTITILITPQNLPILQPLLSKSPNFQPLILPFPKCTSIPQGVENVQDLPPTGFLSMMQAMSHLHQPIIQWFRSHPSPPVAIISDLFLGWTHHLASDLGVPRVLFSPSGAKSVAFINSLWRTMPAPPGPVCFPEIPSSPKYPWSQVSPVYRSYRKGDPVSEFIKEGMLVNSASWGVVYNSFAELESEYFDYTRRDLGHTRVWAVGPLLPAEEMGSVHRGGSGSRPAGEVMSWLDNCADSSVVYVCFGSQAVLTRRQMEALADGLDRSGAHFVWSVKGATKGHEAVGEQAELGAVPAGFEDRVAGRGLIIRGWAPQVAILSHRATGAFLTHCGWNSVLEAIVAGVPMLTWAMSADQFLNATLLVDELGAGVRVCEGAQAIPDSDELARVLAESLKSSQAKWVRAKELSRMAMGAVEEGGSSFRDIDALVKELCGLDAKKEASPS
ncbi:UDP-glycosyltransferase 89B2 [Cinnamomum micranthum f. kanehirae]|uniref:Glycosyltransferase n=1 Tax=Cinnamomum micranthum f. kanehirae TaxID=337451 RepID=A0A3S3QIM4_9MAGN|nr:UDP-glycosyltransferase 89B2 [Cinnamomum micranthum f. kanehirae]